MLHTNWVIQKLDIIDSTQSYAKNLLTREQTVILAKHQTNGYGQNKRLWHAGLGNIHMSLIIPIQNPMPNITFLVCVAVSETILYFDANVPIQHKWVNDILIDGKKVAGILTEYLHGNLIIGVGCNLKVAPCTEFTCLKDYNIHVKIEDFTTLFLQKFTLLYNQYLQNGFLIIRNMWKKRAYKLHEEVVLSMDDKTISGIFYDFSKDGHLILKQENDFQYITTGRIIANS